MFVFLFCMFAVVFCILCSCIVLCTVSHLVFGICVQVYRPPPPGGNSIAVNKYQIIYHKRRDFRKKKKKVIEHKMCFDFLYNFCLKLFSF